MIKTSRSNPHSANTSVNLLVVNVLIVLCSLRYYFDESIIHVCWELNSLVHFMFTLNYLMRNKSWSTEFVCPY